MFYLRSTPPVSELQWRVLLDTHLVIVQHERGEGRRAAAAVSSVTLGPGLGASPFVSMDSRNYLILRLVRTSH